MSESRKRNIIMEVAYSEKKVLFDGTLVDVIAQNAKLTKADAGRFAKERVEDMFSVDQHTENCGTEQACPSLKANMFNKRVNLG